MLVSDTTFVVPALNEERLVGACVRSILDEAPGCRVIVVDNGSTDLTARMAVGAGAEVIHEDRLGITSARQRGLLAATTEWVAFVDADNELPEGWMRAFVEGRDDCVAISGPPWFDGLGVLARLLVFVFYCVGRASHEIMPMLQGGNFAVRRRVLLDVGGFDLDVEFYGEDTETARRMHRAGRVRFDMGLWCYSSERRMVAEGLLRTGARYALNYLWVWALGHPLTRTHADHRA